MRHRSFTTFVAAFVLVSPSLAAADGLVKYKDFSKSPEFVYLATDAEAKAWKGIKSDAEAEAFIALFWARRDPDLKTPANEFKADFEGRVRAADDHFKLSTVRGALTERGRLFILVGPPKSVSITPGDKPFEPPIKAGVFDTVVNEPGTAIGENVTTFTYDAGVLPPSAGIKTLVAKFAVEQTRDSLIGPPDVRRIETQAIKAALKNPELDKAPVLAPGTEVRVATATSKPGDAPAATISPAAMAALADAIAKAPFGSVTALPL
ncbi:MAG TPA: GWxTD domain-containing protein, partial [Thermoanaerobaculia bacterium]|nr:GWxTD domain-containing protein [Thermoanaerobaculia bacterium]